MLEQRQDLVRLRRHHAALDPGIDPSLSARSANRLLRPAAGSCSRSRKAWAAEDRISHSAWRARSDPETPDTAGKSHSVT